MTPLGSAVLVSGVVLIFLLLWSVRSLLEKVLHRLEKIFELLNDETGWAGKKADALRRYNEGLKEQKPEKGEETKA
jgi:hypothetical protein